MPFTTGAGRNSPSSLVSTPWMCSASNAKYLPPIVVMTKRGGEVEVGLTHSSLFPETLITTPSSPFSAIIRISSINPKLSTRLLVKRSCLSHPPLDLLKQHSLFNGLGNVGICTNIDCHLSMFIPCPRCHHYYGRFTSFGASS